MGGISRRSGSAARQPTIQFVANGVDAGRIGRRACRSEQQPRLLVEARPRAFQDVDARTERSSLSEQVFATSPVCASQREVPSLDALGESARLLANALQRALVARGRRTPFRRPSVEVERIGIALRQRQPESDERFCIGVERRRGR